MNEGRYRWFVAMGLLAQADGDPEEAVTLLDQAEQLYRPGFFPDVRPIAAMKARVRIAQGNLAEAADWARDRGVSAADDASYLQRVRPPHPRASAPRAAPGNQDTDALDQAAWPVWTGCARAAETSGRAGSLLEIRMLQALAHDAQGRRTQALECLGPGVGRGARTRRLRAALPGRGRPHGRACCATPSSTASPATTPSVACSARPSSPPTRAESRPGLAGRAVG